MCLDCDNDNITQIPVGPTGSQGDPGNPPDIIGVGTGPVDTAIGTRTFTGVTENVSWAVGQRLRASNASVTKIMEGEITSYSGTELVLEVDYIEGSGTDSNWNLMITGARGATGVTGGAGSTGSTGAAGANAFGVTTGIAVSLGANLYTVPIVLNTWAVVGQVIYIETAGYYRVTVNTPGVSLQVLDLLITGNTPANMVASSGLDVSPAGERGATGATGANGAAGATGATGAQGPSLSVSEYTMDSVSIPSATTIDTVTNNLTGEDKTIIYNGHIDIRQTGAVKITVETFIDGVEETARELIVTAPAAVSGESNVCIPINGKIAIPEDSTLSFRISVNDYGFTTTAKVRFNYFYE